MPILHHFYQTIVIWDFNSLDVLWFFSGRLIYISAKFSKHYHILIVLIREKIIYQVISSTTLNDKRDNN